MNTEKTPTHILYLAGLIEGCLFCDLPIVCFLFSKRLQMVGLFSETNELARFSFFIVKQAGQVCNRHGRPAYG
jgi:hypothetical protein